MGCGCTYQVYKIVLPSKKAEEEGREGRGTRRGTTGVTYSSPRRLKTLRIKMSASARALALFYAASYSYVDVSDAFSTNTDQKVVLITGANKGIGKEISRLVGREEDSFALLTCRDLSLGREAVLDLRQTSEEDGVEWDGELLPVPLDLDDHESIGQAIEWVENEYGRIDVLINNAAVCFNSPTLYGRVEHKTFEEQADITIRTNYFGTLEVTQRCLPLLERSPSPRIINVASYAGRLAILRSQDLVDAFTSETLTIPELSSLIQEFTRDVHDGSYQLKGWPTTCYGMSKLGLIALTRVLARQHPDMMVNSVDPGYCCTDQNNNLGPVDAADGAYTPYLLTQMECDEASGEVMSGLHFYEQQEIPWTYEF